MPNEQLVAYVKDNLERGFSPEEIKRVMIEYGYTPEEVDEIFEYLQITPEEEGATEGEEELPEFKPDEDETELEKIDEEVAHKDSLKSSKLKDWATALFQRFKETKPSETPVDTLHPITYLVLIIGLMAICFVLSLPIVFKSGFGKGGWFITYTMTLFLGLLGGYAIFKVTSLVTKQPLRHILTGVFAPIAGVAAIVLVLYTKRKIYLLSMEHMAKIAPGGISPIGATIGSVHNPFLVSAFFYMLTNAFIVAWFIKEERYKDLTWYWIVVPLYLVVWFITSGLANGFIQRVVPI
ncbi:hypothetical protein DRJ48_02070 [Candidatus Woesearchaeota archaeon]|nr:MAG: hypothetical protein DRJ48_02070 [Candidatus Woesearchaeota archaeon]